MNFNTPLLTYIMYSFISSVLYVFKSIFSCNIYCIIKIYNPNVSFLGMGTGTDYRFKPISWILSYKWADYWPYLEFIYLFFSMWPSVVMCITMGYLFPV